jgi:ferritin-like metal-binding protein YciE
MEKETGGKKAVNTAFKAFNDVYQVQSKTWKHLADIQMNYVNLWQEYLNSCFQRVPTAKNMSDLVAIESGLTAEYGNKFAECSKDAITTISDAQQELMSCIDREELVNPMLVAAQDIWEQGERVVRESTKAPSKPRVKETS